MIFVLSLAVVSIGVGYLTLRSYLTTRGAEKRRKNMLNMVNNINRFYNEGRSIKFVIKDSDWDSLK